MRLDHRQHVAPRRPVSVAVKPLGAAAGQGPRAPIEVYELVGATAAAPLARAAAVHGSSRFVAREAELAQMQACSTRCSGGRDGP